MDEFSQMSSTSFFMKHSFRDVQRKKFHFCLSFCSVFIVVWSALIINTIVEKGPIIFLKLAQSNEGQFDGVVSPSKGFGGMSSFENREGIFMNYTRVMEVVEKKYNLVPRKQFCGTRVMSDFSSRSARDDRYNQYMREKIKES